MGWLMRLGTEYDYVFDVINRIIISFDNANLSQSYHTEIITYPYATHISPFYFETYSISDNLLAYFCSSPEFCFPRY